MTILIVFLFTLANTLSDFWFKIQSLMLNFSVLMLAALPLPGPSITIRRTEFKLDSCHLSLLDYWDQKKDLKYFFNNYFNIYLFQYCSTSKSLQFTIDNWTQFYIDTYDKGIYNWSENCMVKWIRHLNPWWPRNCGSNPHVVH